VSEKTCQLCKKGREDCIYPMFNDVACTRLVSVCWKCDSKLPKDCWHEVLADVLDNGTSLNLAIMFATGQGPHLSTDDTFFAGWTGSGGKQFENANRTTREGYMEEAKRAGVSTQGKVYMHGLAEYPGDPRAWIGTKGEAVKILEEKGWGCDRLGVKARTDVAPPPDIPLADDLVQELVGQKIVTEEIDRRTLTPSKLMEMREEVIEKHGAKKPPPTTFKRKPKRKKARAK